MSATTAAPTAQLRCPRCGAGLAPDQDWCLECGAAATTRILRPPSWKLAAGIVLGVVALVVIAVALAVNGLSRDAHRAVGAAPKPAAATRATSTAAAPAAAPTASTAATTPAAAPALATWPGGRTAWTIVLATASSRAAAARRAGHEVGRGVKAGVLDTSRFDVAANGARFVVFTGQFPNQDAAVAEESRLGRHAPASVFVAQVSPR